MWGKSGYTVGGLDARWGGGGGCDGCDRCGLGWCFCGGKMVVVVLVFRPVVVVCRSVD